MQALSVPGPIVPAARLTRDQVELIKRTIAVGFTDDELGLFIQHCEKTGLDPLTRQIYAIKRKTKLGAKVTIQTSIDGLRLVAQRSGEYRGQDGPYWCDSDGVWRDVWGGTGPPFAAKVGVWRKDFAAPVWGVARLDAYAVRNDAGHLSGLWRTMADVMIAKCAEALALRKAFPHELSGLYGADEISDNAQPAQVDQTTGEVLDAPSYPATKYDPAPPESEDRPAVETVTVKVVSIVKRPLKDDNCKYVIKADDGETYHTFSLSVATAAKVAAEANLPVEIVFSDTKYGRTIQTLREPEPPDAEPPVF